MKASRLLVLAAVLAAGVAQADKVYLKSGSFLTGKTSAVASGELTFASDDLGEVKIPLANVERLEDAGEHVIRYADESEVKKRLSVAKGAYVADGRPLDMGVVKALDPVAETWHGNVALSYNGRRGNTYEDSAAVRADVSRRFEKDRLTGRLAYDYGKTGTSTTDNQKSTDKWEAEVKHDHFWLPKVYHYEDLLWERDMIKNLNARYTVGLGAGYQWLENRAFDSTGSWNFNQELGLNWVKEEWDDNPDQKDGGFCALRYAHHLGFVPVWAKNLEFFHNFKILPQVDAWDKFLAKADLGVQAKLVDNFTLDARLEWDYDSKPADEMKKDDFRYLVGLGYKW